MPPWIGAVIGSAIGLVAILLGALWNASLTRRRDRLIMSEEAKSIAAAIGAELAVHIEMLVGRVSQASASLGATSRARLDALRQPAPMVWPQLANQIGKLDYEMSYQTVRAWSLLEFHSLTLGATLTEIQEDIWTEGAARSRIDSLKKDIPAICATIRVLTGHEPPDLQYSLP